MNVRSTQAMRAIAATLRSSPRVPGAVGPAPSTCPFTTRDRQNLWGRGEPQVDPDSQSSKAAHHEIGCPEGEARASRRMRNASRPTDARPMIAIIARTTKPPPGSGEDLAPPPSRSSPGSARVTDAAGLIIPQPYLAFGASSPNLSAVALIRRTTWAADKWGYAAR